MSNTKRRVFTFEETDLKWINPMLLEWEKENEGTKGGALITKLMKEYKDTLEPSKNEVILEKVQRDYERFKTSFSSRTAKSRTQMEEVFGDTKTKINNAANKLALASKQVVDEIHSQVESRKSN